LKKWIFIAVLAALSLTAFLHADAQSPADVSLQSVNFKSQQNYNVYPGSSNAVLRVDFLFNVNATNPSAKLTDLPAGFSPSSGYTTVSGARDLYGDRAKNVTSGETVYFEFYLNVDKSVAPGTYYATIAVSYISSDGAYITDYFTIPLQISEYPTPQITVVSTSWSPAGYPGTYRTSIQVTIENDGDSAISSATVNITLPNGISTDSPQQQIGALSIGSRTTITFSQVDISESVDPGSYTALLYFTAAATTKDGVSYNASFSLSFNISIDPVPSKYSELKISSAYWGDVRPGPVYSNSLYAQLNLVFVNDGEYAISSIEANVTSPYLIPIQASSVYYGSLAGGASTTLSYYVSINSSSASLQEISFVTQVKYRIDLGGGSYLIVKDLLPYNVYIERYPLASNGSAVGIASWGWYNGYSVFPETENAVLVITVGNKMPFSISGANFSLILPPGFSVDSSTRVIFAGSAIPAYGSFSMQFKVNVGSVSPGNYTAFLTVEGVVNSGGPGYRIEEVLPFSLAVNDPSNAVEAIEWGWKEGSADILSYGANYFIIIRNLKFDAVNNPILYLELPNGITFSSTNLSRGGVTPASQQVSSQVVPIQTIQEYIQQISQSSYQAGGGVAASYQKGSSIYFAFPLNIMLNSTGTLYANASLSFTDAWGTMRKVNFTIPIQVYGTVSYIDVKILGKLDIRNRYTNLTVEVANNGTSPAYNVYLTLSPPSSLLSSQASNSILIASPSTIYIPAIGAKEAISIPVMFVYNPFGIQSYGGGSTLINYGVVPLQVSVQYRDPGGQQHSFSNQIAIAVEPFIELSLTQMASSLTNGTLKINGMLINYGSQTAYRVNIVALVDNTSYSYFIGDVDPGSQSAFSIQVSVPQEKKSVNVTLEISYYNSYNELNKREEAFQVFSSQPATASTTSPQQQLSILNLTEVKIAVAMVGIFLLFAAVLIYRMYSSHAKKLKEMKEE